jgi:beta-mannosidase
VRDHRNAPKEAFRALADVWQPLAVVLTDEGQSGLAISLLNEQPHPFVGTLSVTATRADGVVERDAHRDVRIAGHGVSACTAEEVLGEFLDIVGAYRFGPPRVQRVDVVLRRADSTEVVASATWPPWPVSAVAGVA